MGIYFLLFLAFLYRGSRNDHSVNRQDQHHLLFIPTDWARFYIYNIWISPIHQVQGPCGAYTQYTSIKIAYVSLTVVSSHFSAAQT